MTTHETSTCCGPGYASPKAAMQAPREKLLYTIGLYTGTKVDAPDYLATVDVDPASSSYGQVIHRLEMPNKGDELHHFGWNACSSCHGDASAERRFLIVPGFKSSRIHIVDTADPRAPKLHKVIEPEEVIAKTGLTAPHTVHCLGKQIIISMLGNAEGEGPGGFLTMDENFNVTGRWEAALDGMKYNYDFWYQPRHNVMVSSRVRGAQRLLSGLQARGRGGRALRAAALFLGLREAADREDRRSRPGRDGAARGPLPPQPRQQPRLCRRGALLQRLPLAQERGRVGAGEGDPGGAGGAGGLPDPGAAADHRHPALDGRPLDVLLELAARRPAPVRHQRSRRSRSSRARSGSAACSARPRR